MAYIDKAFFEGHSSVVIADGEFDAMAQRASDVIDALTFRAVERYSLEDSPLFAKVKRAVVYQMEHIQQTFGSLEAWATVVGEGSETIGNYSYSKSAPTGEGGKTVNGLPLSPLVEGVLAPVIALGRKIG